MPDSPKADEDCLYLNVWTGATRAISATGQRPVMVWIFGGAYTEGAGSSRHNDGEALARKGVVLVSSDQLDEDEMVLQAADAGAEDAQLDGAEWRIGCLEAVDDRLRHDLIDRLHEECVIDGQRPIALVLRRIHLRIWHRLEEVGQRLGKGLEGLDRPDASFVVTVAETVIGRHGADAVSDPAS
jgi:hypothetical protein